MTQISTLRSRIQALPLPEGERLSALNHLESAEALADALHALVALFAGQAKPAQPPLRPAH